MNIFNRLLCLIGKHMYGSRYRIEDIPWHSSVYKEDCIHCKAWRKFGTDDAGNEWVSTSTGFFKFLRTKKD